MSDGSKAARARWPNVAALFALVLAAHSVSAQPQFFEPKEHYYKAKGSRIGVRWVVEPHEVQVGRDLTAVLVVTGATNPTEIVKPDLRNLKAFDVFKVTDAADPPREANDKEVRFAYKLAPRSTGVKEIPPLEFSYFNPAAAPGKRQFPTTRTDRDGDAPITVREAPKAVRSLTPIDAPEHLFRIETGPEVLGRGPFVPCAWGWLAAASFGPLAGLAWFLVWRRLYPDAARLARVRRSRAARRAAEAVRKSGHTPDPPAAVAHAVLGYLRTRFPLPESAATPSELARALNELGAPADVVEQTGAVFRACDRARFAPPDGTDPALAESAQALLTRLEALA
ncbi:MAG TPA: hypothetical protein VGE74_05495 [Gemmata sp.]